MAIKIKYRDPKTTDFTKTDMVVNVKDGGLFYKSELGLHNLNKQYFLQHFSIDWEDSTDEEFIDWTNQWPEANAVGVHGIYPTRMILMPFKGTIHKLHFKQTGTNPTTTIRLYINTNDIYSSVSNATVYGPLAKEIIHTNKIGTGNGALVGDMNEVEFNVEVNAGDHIMVTMEASQDGNHESFGHLLYSQTINI